jgi:hypothetical protein
MVRVNGSTTIILAAGSLEIALGWILPFHPPRNDEVD